MKHRTEYAQHTNTIKLLKGYPETKALQFHGKIKDEVLQLSTEVIS